MKVSIEIPKSAIKKAAYLFMSQIDDEKGEEDITEGGDNQGGGNNGGGNNNPPGELEE